MKLAFDICPAPILYPYYHRPECIVIIVDILRAGTSIVTALDHGAKEILPVASTQEAEQYLGGDYLVAAERNAMKCSFAQLGNDPDEYSPQIVQGKSIVLTTTNGTQAIESALQSGAQEVLIGSFSNLSAVAKYCIEAKKSLLVLASGWQQQCCLEDTLYGGALLDRLESLGAHYHISDLTRMALELYRLHADDLTNYLSQADHNQRLIERGFPAALDRCLRRDTVSIIPRVSERSPTRITSSSK